MSLNRSPPPHTQENSSGSVSRLTLNHVCPFGHRSTKHYSKNAEAPDVRDSKLANILIKGILDEFLGELTSEVSPWSPGCLDVFNILAATSKSLLPHSPSGLSDIFPIPSSRSASWLLKELASGPLPSPLPNILRLHQQRREAGKTDVESAKDVMLILKEILNPLVSTGGILVSSETQRLLTAYQNLQERFESPEEIAKVNNFITKRTDVLEAILGIQIALCEKIKSFLSARPDLRGASLAFSEIAMVNDDSSITAVPNSRFLKIVLHNIGKYFLEVSGQSPAHILNHAFRRALENNIYVQSNFLFRRYGDKTLCHGVIVKACPARLSIGRIFEHYLGEK
jgi:hypothetical protein